MHPISFFLDQLSGLVQLVGYRRYAATCEGVNRISTNNNLFPSTCSESSYVYVRG